MKSVLSLKALFCVAAIFAAFFPTCSMAQSVSLLEPRLNDVEIKVAELQYQVEQQDSKIKSNTSAIRDLQGKLGSPAVASAAVEDVETETTVTTTTTKPVKKLVAAPSMVSAPYTYSTGPTYWSYPTTSYSFPTSYARNYTYSTSTPVYTNNVAYTTGAMTVNQGRGTTTYAPRMAPVARTRPTFRARLRGGSCYIDANGNQVCSGY